MTKFFQKKKEDFICQKCGESVVGNGYTNHCPKCLWSKHVDINPGDRLSDCGGLMKPVSVEKEGNEYILTHKCIKCGYEKRNRVSREDDFDEVVKMAIEINDSR